MTHIKQSLYSLSVSAVLTANTYDRNQIWCRISTKISVSAGHMVTMPSPPKLVTKTRTQETDTLEHGKDPGKTNCATRPLEREIYELLYAITVYINIYIRSPCLELISIHCRYSIGFSLNNWKHFHSMYREILYIFLQGSNGDLSRSFEC